MQLFSVRLKIRFSRNNPEFPHFSTTYFSLPFTFFDISVSGLTVLTLYVLSVNYTLPPSEKGSEAAVYFYNVHIFFSVMHVNIHFPFLFLGIYLIAFWLGMLLKNMTGSENIHLGADVTLLQYSEIEIFPSQLGQIIVCFFNRLDKIFLLY